MSVGNPTPGPWKPGPLKYGEKEPWPTDHPLLPSKEPTVGWTGSIYGPNGEQVVRHEASGWKPNDTDWALMGLAPSIPTHRTLLKEALLYIPPGETMFREKVLEAIGQIDAAMRKHVYDRDPDTGLGVCEVCRQTTESDATPFCPGPRGVVAQ